MINLNDSQYDSKEVSIFNGGVAGLVPCVFSRVEKKAGDAKEGSPEYKLFFKDESGAEVNIAFWYLNESASDFVEQLQKAGKKYKHLVHAFYGKDFQIPPASNVVQLLDTVMALLGTKVNTKVELFCTYGTTQSPKQYLQVRSFVPFVRALGDTTTNLSASKIDQMEKIQADDASDLLEPSVSTDGLL